MTRGLWSLVSKFSFIVSLIYIVACANNGGRTLGNYSSPEDPQIFAAQSGSVITGFVLVNTITHQPVSGFNPIANGAVISLASVGTSLSIQANVSSSIGAMVLNLDGVDHTENAAPYSLCGDEGGNYNQDPCASLKVGSHTLTATAYSGAAVSSPIVGTLSINFNIVQSSGTNPTPTPTPNPTPSGSVITGFVLVNTITHQPVSGFNPIANGAVISLASVGTSLSIQANVSSSIGSMVLTLDGVGHTESASPYSLCGDEGGNYNQDPCASLKVGSHTLTATAYSGAPVSSSIVGTLTINFSIVQSSGSNPTPTPTPTPTPSPTPPPGNPTFVEKFNTGSLDTSKWIPSDWGAPGNIDGVNKGTFSSSMLDFSSGMMRLEVTQSVDGNGLVTSVGGEIQSKQVFGYGTYTTIMRMASTSSTPNGAGSTVSGSDSSAFTYINNSETELDIEYVGNEPGGMWMTNWVNNAHAKVPTLKQADDPSWPGMDTGFHTYQIIWSPGRVIWTIDGTQVANHTVNVPSTPAYMMFNHWGTNNDNWGGTASPGVKRYQFVSYFSFTPQ